MATVRAGVQLPSLWKGLGVHGSVDGVFFVGSRVVPGIGGTLGASWEFGRVQPFAEASVRQFAAQPGFRSTYVLVTAGVRATVASF